MALSDCLSYNLLQFLIATLTRVPLLLRILYPINLILFLKLWNDILRKLLNPTSLLFQKAPFIAVLILFRFRCENHIERGVACVRRRHSLTLRSLNWLTAILHHSSMLHLGVFDHAEPFESQIWPLDKIIDWVLHAWVDGKYFCWFEFNVFELNPDRGRCLLKVALGLLLIFHECFVV